MAATPITTAMAANQQLSGTPRPKRVEANSVRRSGGDASAKGYGAEQPAIESIMFTGSWIRKLGASFIKWQPAIRPPEKSRVRAIKKF